MSTTLKTNDVIVEDVNSKRKAFAAYYEDLAVPKTESHFNENFLEISEYRCKLIENIVCHEKEEVELFTEQEIITAIQSLNANNRGGSRTSTAGGGAQVTNEAEGFTEA